MSWQLCITWVKPEEVREFDRCQDNKKKPPRPLMTLHFPRGRTAKGGFISGHLLNQSRDPVEGLLVGDVICHPPVMGDFTIEFIALGAHSSPRMSGGSYELSVTEMPVWGDDDHHAGSPTVGLLGKRHRNWNTIGDLVGTICLAIPPQ